MTGCRHAEQDAVFLEVRLRAHAFLAGVARPLAVGLRPDRVVDFQLVFLAGERRQLENTHALVDAGILLISQGVNIVHQRLAVAIDQMGLEVGSFVDGGADLEIDPVGHAGNQVAAFGIQLDQELLEHNGDGPHHGLTVGAIGELDRQAAPAALHLGRQLEANGHVALGIGLEAHGRSVGFAVGAIAMIIDPDRGIRPADWPPLSRPRRATPCKLPPPRRPDHTTCR